jgi:hypothetical protein
MSKVETLRSESDLRDDPPRPAGLRLQGLDNIAIAQAVNLAVLECRRLRPDLFLSTPSTPLSDPPSFTVSGTTVSIDVQYRTALVFYVTGFVGIRDAEESSDARAAAFMGMFRSLLGTGNLA